MALNWKRASSNSLDKLHEVADEITLAEQQILAEGT